MIIDIISENITEMSPVYKKIAAYIIDNYSEIGFYSVEELADLTGASTASLVRFSRKLGFKGYNQLKKAIQGELINILSPYEKITMTELDKYPWKKRFEDLATNEKDNLEGTLKNTSPEQLMKWVLAIKKAKNIYLTGFGATKFICKMFKYALLSYYEKPVHILSGSVSDFSPELIHLNSGDIVIIFSFPEYSKEAEYVGKYAKDRKADVYLMTKTIDCPSYEFADDAIFCKSNSLLSSNSFVGPLAIVQIMINFLMLSEKKGNMETLKRSMEVEKDGYNYL